MTYSALENHLLRVTRFRDVSALHCPTKRMEFTAYGHRQYFSAGVVYMESIEQVTHSAVFFHTPLTILYRSKGDGSTDKFSALIFL